MPHVTEYVAADFTDRDDEGYPTLDLPDGLEFDGSTCTTPDCGQPIGAWLVEDEDAYGNERHSMGWCLWLLRTSDGAHRYVCEDCADGEDDEP